MSLIARSLGGVVQLVAGNPPPVLPASKEWINVTAELRGLSPLDYAAIELQRPGSFEIWWDDLSSFSTHSLVALDLPGVLGAAKSYTDTQVSGSPTASIVTTNAVPTQLYQKTLNPSSGSTFRASIVAVRGTTASVIGKFVREFTAKREGILPAVLLQDLVPSPDYQELPGLNVSVGVDANNANIVVTGLAATVTWVARVEVVSDL